MRKSSPLVIVAAVLAASNFGCGGGSSTSSPPPPATIAVSVSPSTATVQTGATLRLAATVSNDSTNSGVKWTLSCSAAQCGTISASMTASGTPITYAAPATIPANVKVTVAATSVADESKSSSATLIPIGSIPGYGVSVDYHAFGPSIDSTGFLFVYDQPQVRQMAQAQLQAMADRGASSIQTGIWVEKGPDFCCSNVGATFPMTDQEQANLRAYAQDVASIVSASGNRLRLFIALNWLSDADFTVGSPTTTLGAGHLSPAEFTSRVQTTTDKILAAVGDVTRPDGVKLVDTIFFDSETTIQVPGEPFGKPNNGWFLTTNYPHFVVGATQAGIRPSVYFAGADGCTQGVVLDNTYVDAFYPILNGHRSMFWPYRGLRFMVDNGLPVPTSRIDFDCYIVSTGVPIDQLLQRILDDADATLPSLGAPMFYDIPETYYLLDPNARLQYGQAFASQAAQNPRLQRVSFWTWPDGGGTGQNPNYPFTIEDFLPPPAP
jgi:hypothetical protein